MYNRQQNLYDKQNQQNNLCERLKNRTTCMIDKQQNLYDSQQNLYDKKSTKKPVCMTDRQQNNLYDINIHDRY